MSPSTSVVRTTAEHVTDRDTVGVSEPRLSWVVETEEPGWVQTRAEVEVSRQGGAQVTALDGPEQVLVDWPSAPLQPREQVQVRVRVAGPDGELSGWGEPLTVVAGFLADGEWSAEMVGLAEPSRRAQPALVRGMFTVAGPVRRATLYATAHGVYQVEVNGREVDDEVLKPGWTAYRHRLLHETTDVTDLLREGENVVGVWLSGGWWAESYGFQGMAEPFYGDQPAVAAQLVVELEDGSVQTVVSDGTWRASGDGPLARGGIYGGETFDATLVQPGWSEPGFDAGGWSPVRVDGEFPTPEARTSPGARRIEEVAVKDVLRTPSGKLVLDFGQNLVGWIRIRVRGPRGATVVLHHAEVLEDGELGIRPLRMAEARDEYVLAGSGDEVWEPRSTFHGFRYAQVEGWPGELDPADVVAVVVHSDMRRTGWFSCSHPLLDRLHENVVWGMRGNFLHLPTDCPQRDERLGWTGDIQVFAPTAGYLYDSAGFLASWLRDLAVEQRDADGVVPFIVPSVLRDAAVPAAAWGDAATVIPEVLHERFGDRRVLADQLDSMSAWVDVLADLAGERYLWEGKFQFGDWLDPAAPPDWPQDAATDPDVVASAHLFRSADIVARTARLLGHHEQADRYASLAERVRQAFLREYVTPAGRLLSDSQTGYAMALVYGIVTDEDLRRAMGDRLAELVRSAGYRVGTGFVGTPIVQDALTDAGHLDVAGRLMLQTENPSWLYPVTLGATTVWERWDSMLEDGSINPGEMTSFNHYAFGAIADWLHRVVAGLAPAAPGYRRLRIAPRPLTGLDWARTEHDTPYGRASVGWERSGDAVVVTAVVPAGTTAEVRLPFGGDRLEVGSGSHRWQVAVPGEALAAVPGPVSLGSSLADIVDDPEAYRTVLRVYSEHDEEHARTWRDRTEWVPTRPLAEAMFMVPHGVQRQIGEALDELSRARSGTQESDRHHQTSHRQEIRS
jgi:alpha-L-rhamnosidase